MGCFCHWNTFFGELVCFGTVFHLQEWQRQLFKLLLYACFLHENLWLGNDSVLRLQYLAGYAEIPFFRPIHSLGAIPAENLYWVFGWYCTETLNMIVATNRLVAIIFNQYYHKFTVCLARVLCVITVILSLVAALPLGLNEMTYNPKFKVSKMSFRVGTYFMFPNYFTWYLIFAFIDTVSICVHCTI